MHIRKQRLLTPGPVPIYPPALHAMQASDMHHRTKEFEAVYRTVLTDMKEVLGTSASDVLCFAASGSGAMDAAVSNLFSAGDKVIVGTAGKFGERWVEITKAYGLDVTLLKAEYGDVVTPERVEQALKSTPGVKGVFITASETSTGAMHDVEAMGKIIARTDALFVVDGITAMGTMPLDIDGWGLDVVAGGSQKAFMIPPGLAFLAVSPKAWKAEEKATLPHYYFDLKLEKKNGDAGTSSWTPAVSLILALAESLKYIKQIGMPKLIENAQLLALGTRAAATALGLELFAKQPGNSVTTVRAPKGIDSGVIVKEFKSRFGAIIANGQGSMQGQIFRFAHIGYFDFVDTFAMIAALEIILHKNGYPVKFGSGVAAVQEIYSRAASAEPGHSALAAAMHAAPEEVLAY
jgi:aspartate aminotransferase-like enzyme